MIPDNLKYKHTPDDSAAIEGCGLANAVRVSRWTSIFDVAQSVTGGILALFLWCHMAFTSSVQISGKLFDTLVGISGGKFIDGFEHLWMHTAFISLIGLLVVIHMCMALRRFPVNVRQLGWMWGHVKLVHHTDTTLWWVQLITGVLLTGLVFQHLIPMIADPGMLGAKNTGIHVYHGSLIVTFIFLCATELHGMIGLYRLCMKWGAFDSCPNARNTLRVIMWVVIVAFIICGTMTMLTYNNIGDTCLHGLYGECQKVMGY